jgi:2-isopropylmalate synthase
MPGVNFSAWDKFTIAKKMDELGFHFIEGGFPASNEKDREFFDLAREYKWKNTKICGFGSTHHKKYTPNEDPSLRALSESKMPVIVLFGKSSRFHAEKILEVSPDKNIDIIEHSVQFLRKNGQRVIFDAEHFFDGFFEDPKYSIECILAAERGGAENITLADTNGGMLPEHIAKAFSSVQKKIRTPLGIHAHNDSDLAVANTLVAISAGATLIQGTVNGIGERCGNANLCSVIANLQLKKKNPLLSEKQLKKLTELSRLVQELCNLRPRKDLPFVGKWAFRHKGGIHVSAMKKNSNSYQHIDPSILGNESSIGISELSGKANISDFLERIKIPANTKHIQELLLAIKAADKNGLNYEAGEASLEILAKTVITKAPPPFHIINFFVRTQESGGKEKPEHAIEATVRTKINDQEFHTAGLGNGPVNALDVALRKALEPIFPVIKEVELTDYKVRILDISLGTSAKTRVQIESRKKNCTTWQTVGCGQNIISASMQALVESFIYAIWKKK